MEVSDIPVSKPNGGLKLTINSLTRCLNFGITHTKRTDSEIHLIKLPGKFNQRSIALETHTLNNRPGASLNLGIK